MQARAENPCHKGAARAVARHSALSSGPIPQTSRLFSTSRTTGRCARRGVAEIELIVACFILVSLLMLSMSAVKIGMARLNTVRTAQYETFHDANSRAAPQHVDGALLSPVPGFAAQRSPALPNRAHSLQQTEEVFIRTGDQARDRPATLFGQAAAISPSWVYSGYPVGPADHAANGNWVTEYVAESHGQLVSPLRLVPAWEP